MANILFIEQCASIVQDMRDKKILTPEGEYYRPVTIRNISNKVENFREYQEHLGAPIKISDINFEWVENYRLFLLDKGYAKNTVSAILANLKAFLKRLNKAGLTHFTGSGIRTSSEVTTAVANTISELKYMLSLDLSATPGKERIRDFYVAHCFTGLRIYDMFRLVKDIPAYIKEVEGKKYLEIKTWKKGEVVVIPASPLLLNILERRGKDFGRRFSEQYYRRELKALFADTILDREIMYCRTEGGEQIERLVMFSSLMGTHTARRTFATNAYIMGLNPMDIMKITGHKTYTSFVRYIRCENMAVAIRISGHEFFNITI